MEITKTIEITLTPDEVKEIMINHLRRTNDLDIENVYFNVVQDFGDDDFPDTRPSYILGSVRCVAKETENSY